MNYKSLKKQAINYIAALSILSSSILPGCNYHAAKASTTNQSTEQAVSNQSSSGDNILYRHPGMARLNGGSYAAGIDGDFYEDPQSGERYFLEEKMIKNISTDGVVRYSLSDSGANYANEHECKLDATLIDTKGDSDILNDTFRFDIEGGLEGDIAEFKIPEDNPDLAGLRAAAFCVEDGKPVVLASYPLGDSNQDYRNSKKTPVTHQLPVAGPQNQYGKIDRPVTPAYQKPAKNVKPESNGDYDIKTPKKGFDPITGSTQDKKTYQSGTSNQDVGYHLKTDCNNSIINAVKSPDGREYPTDMFGLVPITDDKTCNVYLDESDNSFGVVYFEPDLENIVSSRSIDDKKVTVSFKQPGQYVLIAETEKYGEKDILVFDVIKKPVYNQEGGLEQQLSFDELNIGRDEFSANVLVKPFMRKRINITNKPAYKGQKTLNQILEEYHGNRLPVVVLHQDNSIIIENEYPYGVRCNTELQRVTGLSIEDGTVKLNLNDVKLDKSRLSKKVNVSKNDKGKLLVQHNNILNRKVEFPYIQIKAGSYDLLPGNTYLLTLNGYDSAGRLVDIDRLLIEINANLLKEYAKGFAVGYVAGLGTGGIFNLVMPRTSEASEAVKIIKHVVDGTKTGGTIPK